jgi:hypothetical protein
MKRRNLPVIVFLLAFAANGTAQSDNRLAESFHPVAIQTTNISNLPSSSTVKPQVSGNVAFAAASWSVKNFGAIGDKTTDDTAAIQAALTKLQSSGGGCLYFPPGVYKTTAQLSWSSPLSLCLLGESHFKSSIYYQGSLLIDSAVFVGLAKGFAQVRIENLGIAANMNAKYAFHAIQVGAGEMRNVAFSGGSSSAFEGDFWNGQRDLDNLIVEPEAIDGVNFSCVNGLTFDRGAYNGTEKTFPSTQFTLTSPTVMNCKGTGLNIQNGQTITVNNGQISNNNQNLYDGCSGYACNATGNTFISTLLEKESKDDVIRNRSIFLGLMASGADAVDTYASATFIGSQLMLNAMSGTSGPLIINSWLSKVNDQSRNGIQYLHNFSVSGGGTATTEQASFYDKLLSDCGGTAIHLTYDFNRKGNGTYPLSTVPVNLKSNHWSAWIRGNIEDNSGNVNGLATSTELTSSDPAIRFVDGATLILSQSSSGLSWTISGEKGYISGIVSVDFYPDLGCGAGQPSFGVRFSRPLGIVALVASGTQSISGCSLSSAVGGATAGSFKSGITGACTVTIKPGITAPNGFSCSGSDLTHGNLITQTMTSTTECMVSGATTSGDLITWQAVAF